MLVFERSSSPCADEESGEAAGTKDNSSSVILADDRWLAGSPGWRGDEGLMLLDERSLGGWAEEAVDWAAAKIKGAGRREFELDRRSRGGGSGAGWREMDLEGSR